MKIALDIDSVLADPMPIVCDEIYKKYGVRFEKRMVYQWDTEKCVMHFTGVKMSGKDFLDLFTPTWARWQEIKPLEPYARYVAMDLLASGWADELDIVTYAAPETFEHKKLWVKKNIAASEKFNVVNSAEYKGWKYSMPYDAFIDDCPHIVVGAQVAGRMGILVDQPWNRGVDDELIHARVKSLMELPEVFRKARYG